MLYATELDSRLPSQHGDLGVDKTSLSQAAIASHAALPKAQWVGMQLTRTFIVNTRTTVISSMVTLPVTLFMLWGWVSGGWLLAWAAVVVGLTLHRNWVIKRYRTHFTNGSAQDLDTFFNRHQWTWAVNAVVWTALMFLYFDKVPLENQYVCMMVMVGMGAFSVSLMSPRLDCFYQFINAIGIISLTVVAAAALRQWLLPTSSLGLLHNSALLVLIGIFWFLLRMTGKRQHSVLRRGFELQYDNERLISSLRERSAAATEAVRVKERLLANAAHDLRQPVHALAFYADWLRSEPDMAAQVMPKILQATASVNTLFNSMFDFAKIESGGVVARMEAVPVCEVINDLALQFAPSAQTKKLQFRTRIQPAYIQTDPILIRRILGNLLANAIRYTDHGGVLLSCRVRAGWVWIDVWDTGLGIESQYHRQVFQEFYRIERHQGTEDGFGLGLAIVDRLVHALNHRIGLRSVPGRGTRFRLAVPLGQKPAG